MGPNLKSASYRHCEERCSSRLDPGPLLFILYINDLPHIVRQCQVRQYADDTSLAHVSSDVRDLENGLTDDLENVSKWVDANKLKFNMKKTHLVLMSRKQRKNELCV